MEEEENNGFIPDNELEGDPCELPAAKRRRELVEANEEDEDRFSTCQICKLSDETTRPENLPPCIIEFRQSLSTQSRSLPEADACKVIAEQFNNTCYKQDRNSVRRIGIQKMTTADVFRHLQHTMNLQEGEEMLVNERIWYTREMIRQIEKKQLWVSSREDPTQISLSAKGFTQWNRANGILKMFLEMRQKKNNSTIKENKTTPQLKKKPRYHFGRD